MVKLAAKNSLSKLMEPATTSHGLIDRVKKGDYEAFTGLFEKYRRRLAVLIHYRIGQEMRGDIEIDDVLQETMLKAFRDIHQFTYQSPGSFMRWVSRIADHVIADIARFQSRQKRHAAEVLRFRSQSNPGGPEPLDSKTPSRVLAGKERLLDLLEKLNSLPEEYRQSILLTKIEGLSTHEMARRLGKSNEAAALLLHRAIRRFRALQHSRDGQ